MSVDYYEILEVSPGAREEQIRAAITAQRRIWVRRQSSPDPERRAHAEQRVRDIDAAERALLDPAARLAYNKERERLLRTGGSSTGPGSTNASGSPNGNGAGGRRGPGRREMAPPPSTASPAPRTGPRQDADLDSHLARGDRYLQQGRWRLAQAEFEYVRERAPDDLRALTGLGAVHVGAGRVKDGLAILERAAAEHPDDEHVKIALATALYEVAIAGMADVGDGPGRERPVIISRRQLALARRNLRRIQRLELSDWNVSMHVEELKDLVAEARAPIWSRGHNLRFYFIPLVGAVLVTALPNVESLRVVGAFWIVVIVATYVFRHRQPAWKHHRRELGRGRRPSSFGETFRKGI